MEIVAVEYVYASYFIFHDAQSHIIMWHMYNSYMIKIMRIVIQCSVLNANNASMLKFQDWPV
jgi:hypothetical protein